MQLLGASTAFLHINIHPIQQQVPSEKEKKSRGKKCLYEFRIYLRSWNDCLLACLLCSLLVDDGNISIYIALIPPRLLLLLLICRYISSCLPFHFLMLEWKALFTRSFVYGFRHCVASIKRKMKLLLFWRAAFAPYIPRSFSRSLQRWMKKSVGFEIIEMCKALTRKCLFLKGVSVRAFFRITQ